MVFEVSTQTNTKIRSNYAISILKHSYLPVTVFHPAKPVWTKEIRPPKTVPATTYLNGIGIAAFFVFVNHSITEYYRGELNNGYRARTSGTSGSAARSPCCGTSPRRRSDGPPRPMFVAATCVYFRLLGKSQHPMDGSCSIQVGIRMVGSWWVRGGPG